MTHPAWGKADVFAILLAVGLTALFLVASPRHRTGQGISVLLAAGLSLGPLLLILLDPFAQLAGVDASLLELVLNEGRTTLWWAAAVASVYVIRDLL